MILIKEVFNVNNNINVCLKSVSDFKQDENNNKIETTFFVDAYQRGYRWTKNEVRALLDDIKEFSQSDYNKKDNFYCLQPIIVTLKNGQWKVIDGQQRLTTLFLIYIFYINIYSSAWKKEEYPFKLVYKNKTILEDCLNYLSLNKNIDELSLNEKYSDDMDCYFVIEAYKEVFSFFSELKENPKTCNYIDDMKKIFDNNMKVIWYQICDCSEEDEIRIFTKINMGKIPLTNSELIKALLLKDSEDKGLNLKQDNIAIKWDEIEANLIDDSFWSFLVNNRDIYSTRIDFIFEILAEDINKNVFNGTEYKIEKEYNQKYFSFYVINNYFKKMKNLGRKDYEIVEDVWNQICGYYRMFRDWFKNRTWYHLIGFIIYNSKIKNIDKIFELADVYKNKSQSEKGHKSFFEKELKRMCQKNILLEEFNKEGLESKFSNLIYGQDNETIKKILLCYNLAILEVEEKQTDVRFPFDKFKEKNVWDLEHINAIEDGRPSDDSDINENKCKKWLEAARELPNIEKITTSNNENVQKLIEKTLNEKLYLSKNDNSIFIKIYETIIGYFNDLEESNSIDNLTLLDSGINRSYKNDVFPIKRKTIIEKCCSEKYIPVGTKKVFLKGYVNSNSLLKWTKEDSDYYFEDVVDKIYLYLKEEVS